MVCERVVSRDCWSFTAALLHGGSGIQGMPGSHEDNECSCSKSCRLGCAARQGDRVFADTGSHQWLQWHMLQGSPSLGRPVASAALDPSNLHRSR